MDTVAIRGGSDFDELGLVVVELIWTITGPAFGDGGDGAGLFP